MAKSFSRKARLIEEVQYELEQLGRLAASAKELAATGESLDYPWAAAAAAKYVSDLFAGLENLCKRRYAFLRLPQPVGHDYHLRMLEDFLSTASLGQGLAPEMRSRLKEYLRFRHRFIHGYGFDVTWPMVEEPLLLLPDTVALLDRVWRSWLDTVSDR